MPEYLLFIFVDGLEDPLQAKSSQWLPGSDINMEISTKGYWDSVTHTFYPSHRINMIQWRQAKK